MILTTALAVAIQQATIRELPVETEADRVPKTRTGGDCLIQGGRVFTVTGKVLPKADVLIRDGKIAQIAPMIDAPPGVTVIDAAGKSVMPGLIDAHSHRGQMESNEWSSTAVPEVRIHDVIDPEQSGLWFNLANGITTGMLLHGSSDAIGGQSVVVKHLWKRRQEDMVFPGAPRMIKFALGENVSEKLNPTGTRFPKSRAGVESVYRRAFADAKTYMEQWAAYEQDKSRRRPRKDLRLEALADILRGKIWVQCHSYRQDEILMMVRLSQEFGFKLTMQHALEAYKVAPELAKAKVPASMFSDAWAYKIEVFEAIPMGVALCVKAGVLSSVNTDSFGGLAPLNLDAAKTMRYGVSEAEALKLVTINPARQIGVDKWVGSLEVGKNADVSIWNGHPLSVYSKCAMTLIDGEVVFERRDAFGVDKASKFNQTVKPRELAYDKSSLPDNRNTYALIGGRVMPVSGAPIEGGTVVVRDGKIVSVGGPTTTVPADALRVDVKGMVVTPGLIDAGSDVGLNEVSSVPSMQDQNDNGPFQADLNFLTAVNPESVKIPIARCGGVTNALVRPSGTGLVAGQGRVAHMAGSTFEEFGVAGSATLHVFYPEGLNRAFRAFLPPNIFEEREKGIKTSRAALADQFDLAKRYRDLRESGQVSIDARLEAYLPFLRGARPVFVHANAEEAIRAALKFASDAGIKMVLAGGAEAWKVIPELQKAGVPVVYTAPATSCPAANQPYGDLDPYDASLVAPSLMAKAGIRFALQVGDSSGIQNLPWAAGMLCANGLSPSSALRSVTLSAAEILGVADKLGSLQPGKVANLVVWDGDPLEVTTQVRHVFIAGKPTALQSKFTQLFRKYEQRIGG